MAITYGCNSTNARSVRFGEVGLGVYFLSSAEAP